MKRRDEEQDWLTIPLTKGKFALVDKCDAHLGMWKWFVLQRKNGKFTYAVRTMETDSYRKTIYMHHFIVGCPINRHFVVDHINGDSLDNRRSNLRIISERANHSNLKIHREGKPVGVSWHKRSKKWIAHIYANGRLKHLGYFNDIESGRKAYAEAFKEIVSGVK